MEPRRRAAVHGRGAAAHPLALPTMLTLLALLTLPTAHYGSLHPLHSLHSLRSLHPPTHFTHSTLSTPSTHSTHPTHSPRSRCYCPSPGCASTARSTRGTSCRALSTRSRRSLTLTLALALSLSLIPTLTLTLSRPSAGAYGCVPRWSTCAATPRAPRRPRSLAWMKRDASRRTDQPRRAAPLQP